MLKSSTIGLTVYWVIMGRKNDPKTVFNLGGKLVKMAKGMLEEAKHFAKRPLEPDFEGVMHPAHEWYSDAASRAYAAHLFEEIGKAWQIQATIKQRPNMKCRFCGGKARICYPRHLEGKSCG